MIRLLKGVETDHSATLELLSIMSYIPLKAINACD